MEVSIHRRAQKKVKGGNKREIKLEPLCYCSCGEVSYHRAGISSVSVFSTNAQQTMEWPFSFNML